MEHTPHPLRPRSSAVAVPTALITAFITVLCLTMMVVAPAFTKMLEKAKGASIPKLTQIIFNIGIPMSEYPLVVILGIVICGGCLGVIFEQMRVRRVNPTMNAGIMTFSFFAFAILEATIAIAMVLPLIGIIRQMEGN